jgi:hypothetical protein
MFFYSRPCSRSCSVVPGLSTSLCFLLLISAPAAKAQCNATTVGWGDVGVIAANPFHAEIISTTTGGPNLPSPLMDRHPESVARDSQGRVRTERVTREFIRDTGPEAGTKVEQHIILICDPVAKTITQIDTATATAKIIHSRPSVPRPGLASTPPRTFCSLRMMRIRTDRVDVEDLGDQDIEGVLAHGQRTKALQIDSTGSARTLSDDTVTERWCSEEISAMVLTVSENTKTGRKYTVAMRNIERTEPDPQLFKISADYSITETAEGPPPHTSTNVSTASQP